MRNVRPFNYQAGVPFYCPEIMNNYMEKEKLFTEEERLDEALKQNKPRHLAMLAQII